MHHCERRLVGHEERVGIGKKTAVGDDVAADFLEQTKSPPEGVVTPIQVVLTPQHGVIPGRLHQLREYRRAIGDLRPPPLDTDGSRISTSEQRGNRLSGPRRGGHGPSENRPICSECERVWRPGLALLECIGPRSIKNDHDDIGCPQSTGRWRHHQL